MKINNVEINELSNELLIQGRGRTQAVKNILLGLAVFIVVFSFVPLLLLLGAGEFDLVTFLIVGGLILVSCAFGLGLFALAKYQEKIIKECDAEIEARVKKRKMKSSYLSENNEKAKNYNKILYIVVIVAIAVIILFAVAAPSLMSGQSRHDKVFDKNPNDWSDSDKEYVDDLFDYIDKNSEK